MWIYILKPKITGKQTKKIPKNLKQTTTYWKPEHWIPKCKL